ncbi:hypothetical protein [Coleofasciculus sp. FACHB-1120]|uniref:hypothetical protein n=1 Tax=Coleofasciculus sp. FACHB-1120 TaxID=2692783 RepID=UPI001688C736|nr:hypothetical protein [Coleofasciculus sp. FACHB-1120]MBD2742552.1 hypothetical protein [Coleofasciculus sp. FACHB-1120]
MALASRRVGLSAVLGLCDRQVYERDRYSHPSPCLLCCMVISAGRRSSTQKPFS